ncbi:Por secretion system C-terminal sorting domain-containing protein [Hymenobacter daecheongensis DSM 21074]|uniref:Por secretion system C-terminal sorting domain-containing protein n=1 Tax=Hymenobacter daecheongensis DSM 21074 TaxID=1121955 RepID=A0A1M6MJJ3_9BACT|nr:T9SS type A sorting domain-containing protein [Hymenobacter daecheongensis]SHJ83642.1 Por secretion system C-terminal sorting domain-containing protein [Hymenobacter daecheongensis DSM 21074]
MSVLLRARRWSGILSFLLLTAATAATTQAQSTAGFGDWQLHLPNNRARALADTGPRVYVAAEDAFFFYDKALNTTQLLSRRDGLHDVGVRTLAYDAATKQTLIAYNNGNLDVIREDGSILNVTDILRKQLTGNKIVYHIFFNSRLAYLSCSFGLVVFDMSKLEVRDTYGNIGRNGQPTPVFATAVANGSLFAATADGLMRGRLTDNLFDYRRWTIDIPDPTGRTNSRFRTLAVLGDRVYAGIDYSNVYCYNCGGVSWQPVFSVYADRYRQFTPSAAGLLITSEILSDRILSVLKADNTLSRLGTVAQIPNPQMALQDKEGAFYIADSQNGLLKTTNGQQVEKFVTNAPANARSFSVLADARTNTVDIFSGGYQDRYVQQDYRAGFYEYKEGQWTNFTAENYPDRAQYPNIKDLARGVRTPDGTLYIATYGDGVLQWKGLGKFTQFTQGTAGSPLRSAIPTDPAYTRVTDVAVDAGGSVWVVNRHQRPGLPGLHIYSPGANTWRTAAYFAGSENLDRIVLDDNGFAWVSQARLGGNGIDCYDDKTKTARHFSGGAGLPSGEIYDLVKDRKGDIWAATIKGVAVYNDPSQALLAGNTVDFRTPIVRTGISAGFPVLRDEVVHAIAVDGGNRKWFGTDRGLWLFNEDGDEELQHFTTENSPLPSNNIVDIDINNRTGEVFVATTGGVVAYRGSATVTEGEVSCAKVSPNPVRTDFSGEVGISGLANNGYVKITDVTGKLVYQTRPNGGTVVWNLTDYNGRKVQSGVYLVLSSDADGKNGCISKVAVVAR